MKSAIPHQKKFLITERSLNYLLRPVQVRRVNYPYTYEVENMGKMVSVTVDKAWTPMNHLVLDFIGHEIYKRVYAKVHKSKTTWKNSGSSGLLLNANAFVENFNLDILYELKRHISAYLEYESIISKQDKLNNLIELDRFSSEHDRQKCIDNHIQLTTLAQTLYDQIGPDNIVELDKIVLKSNGYLRKWTISINPNDFIKRFVPFFQKRRKEYLISLLERTSKARFSLEYPLRVPVVEDKVLDDGNYESEIRSVYPELIQIRDENLFNIEQTDGKLLIHFDSLLGRAYTHNLLTLNTDWFNKAFLSLDGYASAIYRRFFVTKSKNSSKSIMIHDLIDYFGFKANTDYRNTILSAFENIVSVGLINDFQVEYFGSQFSKGRINVERSSK